MSAGIEFLLRMRDLVSPPALRVMDTLRRTERQIESVQRAAETGANRMDRAWARVERRMGSVHGSMQRLQRVALGTGIAVAGMVGAGMVGRQLVSAVADKESTLTSLTAILRGDRRGAAETYKWAERLAAATPFQQEPLIQATRDFLSSGYNVKQTQRILTALGDGAAALGVRSNDLPNVVLALNQIKRTGRVQGDELNQLTNYMPITPVLKEKFGDNWKKKVEAGQVGADEFMLAITSYFEKNYQGQGTRRGQDLDGLLSTLSDRPKQLFSSLYDNGALDPLKKFLGNLAVMSDFDRPPGSQIKARFQSSMKGLSAAMFGGLADATGGERGVQFVNRLLDQLDRFSTWWSRNGPAIVGNLRGIWQGLQLAWAAIRPVVEAFGWLLAVVGQLGGEGGNAGRALGFILGMTVAMNALNIATLGSVASLARLAAGAAVGTLAGVGRMAWLEIATNPAGKLAGARGVLGGFFTRLAGMAASVWGFLGRLAPLFARMIPWVLRIGAAFLGLSNPVGLVILAVTTLASLGALLYNKWQPFHTLVDGIWDGLKGAASWAWDVGKNLWQGLGRWWDNLPGIVKSALSALFPGITGALQAGVGRVPAAVADTPGSPAGHAFQGGGAAVRASGYNSRVLDTQVGGAADVLLDKLRASGGNYWSDTGGAVRRYNGLGKRAGGDWINPEYVGGVRAAYDTQPWVKAIQTAQGDRLAELQYISSSAEREAQRRGLDPRVLKAIMWNESLGWQADVNSSDGKGGGLGQVTGYHVPPKTAANTGGVSVTNHITVGGKLTAKELKAIEDVATRGTQLGLSIGLSTYGLESGLLGGPP